MVKIGLCRFLYLAACFQSLSKKKYANIEVFFPHTFRYAIHSDLHALDQQKNNIYLQRML